MIHRRPFAILGLSLLLFAGCIPNRSVTYQLSFSVTGAPEQRDLAEAALRVVERRLESMGETLVDKNVKTGTDTADLAITVSGAAPVDVLTEQLQEPIKFRIMAQAPDDRADIIVTGHGGFKETGINDSSLYSVQASQDSSGKGVITLNFTPEGRKILAKVFKANKGKYLGLFVRGKLASKLLVETDTLLDQIVIRDLPSADLARVFADDINVGLHVSFSPRS